MSNFLLISDDTKINLDLVRSFRYHKSSNSVHITFTHGDTEKYFVPEDFDFSAVTNVPHTHTLRAEKNRYIVVYNIDVVSDDEEAVGWMEYHQVIGWEQVQQQTRPITTQYLASNCYNKKVYIMDIQESTVREVGLQYSLENIHIKNLDRAVAKGDILEDHAEYIRNVLSEITPKEDDGITLMGNE